MDRKHTRKAHFCSKNVCRKRFGSKLWIPLPVVAMAFFTLLLQHSFGRDAFEDARPHHDVVDTKFCDDFIKIDGSTNVNHFHFTQEISKPKKLIEESVQPPETLSLKVPAHEFETSNPRMYKDFLEFIRADKYPDIDITIFFGNDQINPEKPGEIIPEIKVGLAGNTHTYKVPGKIRQCKDKSMHINGEVSIDLEDFGLKPPTKFMGMVKVKNEVFINFGLTLKN
ncbi:MAG: YceI family protein [Marinilabilia sp.]